MVSLRISFTLSLAERSLSAREAGPPAEPVQWARLALAFAVLIGAVLMPALVYVIKVVLRLAWAFVRLAAKVALHEMVKWLLLAGAASLGLLHYLEWLSALH
jgi:hypothetical protein